MLSAKHKLQGIFQMTSTGNLFVKDLISCSGRTPNNFHKINVYNLKFTADGPFIIGKHLIIKENPYKTYSEQDLEYTLKVHG